MQSYTPEQYGAQGNGTTNDTDAFVALAAAVSTAGGGLIEFNPGATYIVGKQTYQHGAIAHGDMGETYTAYAPSRVLFFDGLVGPLIIHGNGARMKAASALRYGTFSSTTENLATQNPSGYVGPESSAPYVAMINVESCIGPVVIRDLELDGNSDNYIWGGQAGDTGWQITSDGMLIQNNTNVIIENVYSHHHGHDGIEMWIRDAGRLAVRDSRFEYNCRLGGNLRGGTGLHVVNCRFDYNAKGTHYSAPAAGFDLEKETSSIAGFMFEHCFFRHNRYTGVVADNGTVTTGSFNSCVFWTGANEGGSLYISRPRFSFRDCVIGGPISIFDSGCSLPGDLPSFRRCYFTDDPTVYSLDGTVNTGTSSYNIDGVLGTHTWGMYDSCQWYMKSSRISGAPSGVAFDNCILNQAYDPTPGPGQLISGIFHNRCHIFGYGIYTDGHTTFDDNTCTFNGTRQLKTS